MNVRKLSVNKACIFLAVLLLAAMVTVSVALYALTQDITAVWYVLLFGIFVLFCSICFMVLVRRKLAMFSDAFCSLMDDMLSGNMQPKQTVEEESLFYKIEYRLNRLYEVMQENKNSIAQLERAEQQIDEILTARRQDKRDQAALEALTAVHSGPGEIGEYDPNAVVVASAETDTTTTTTTASTPTYVPADANGKYQYLGEYLLTAYCPCPICCGKWSNMENPITASGARATAGWTIAAPKNFAFGTKIMIDGQIYEVQDRGGAITGNHFDVFCNTHQEALNFNMRTTSAYLVVE